MNHLFCNVCVCCQHVCLCCGRPLFTAQSGHPLPFHLHDPNNSALPPPHRNLNPDIIEGEEELRQCWGHLCGQLSHGDRCCNCQLMDWASRTSLGSRWPGLKEQRARKKDWEKTELAQAGRDGGLGHIDQPFAHSHGD